MKYSFFAINRLRVLRRGASVYDQKFHLGVNIIRGENGSGKSTIADFIFYVLGGEFESWKAAAKQCEEVQAEVTTQGGLITIRREIGGRLTPAWVFFGNMEDAERQGLDGWQRFPIRRQETQESLSQIIFRASGVPEAQSEGASNITMHQIMRLLYSDQRTPASRLFRFELFDTKDIREAVGNLICGTNVYELYSIQLSLRGLEKAFGEKQALLNNKLAALPVGEGASSLESLNSRIADTEIERGQLVREIESVDSVVDSKDTKEFVIERQKALKNINSIKGDIRSLENRLEVLALELGDIHNYASFLNELAEKLPNVERSSEIIGNIEFTYCPACLAPLSSEHRHDHCALCGSPTDPEREHSKYLQIKIDIDIQTRESRQLVEDKSVSKSKLEAELRRARQEYVNLLSEFSTRFDLSVSPRESYLARRYQRMGQLEREREHLIRLREILLDVRNLSDEKAELQREITILKDRRAVLEREGQKRRATAMTLVSSIAKTILVRDLPRQKEFQNPGTVALEFGDDAILVDGEMNFAESSNVVLKNAAILSLFSAALVDSEFYHPRFVLFDNIEDKGMEPARSHNFQDIIVSYSRAAPLLHQIIFTTSMMNPQLEVDELVIGPRYTHEHRTLDVQI